MTITMQSAKKIPGIGQYETTKFDELKIKPPKGLSKVSMERVTPLEEVMLIGKESPSSCSYEPVKLVSSIVKIYPLYRILSNQDLMAK